MIKIIHKGDFKNLEKFFRRNQKGLTRNERFMNGLRKFGQKGVDALREATPKDTGLTADSWGYIIYKNMQTGVISLEWYNTNENKGAHIALLIQYGHATSSGYWIEGIDYINPALKPLFDEIADEAWAEVTGNAYY